MKKSGQKVFDPDKLAGLILTLTALSGEFPMPQAGRIPSTSAYKEKVLKSLKSEKLVRTYYRDGLRGLRLTAKAKRLLAEQQPDWFSPLFTGDTMTNAPKYTILHRLRLHRMAEVLVSMLNADVTIFPWEKPAVFTPELPVDPPYISRPSYFSSREVKSTGLMSNKIRNSRFTGILLCERAIFAVYNTGASQMKWEYKAEARLKSFLEIELCLHRLPRQFGGVRQSAILFGANMDCLPPLVGTDSDNRQSYFLSGEGFARFYYLTSDHYGDVVLRLLCDPAKRAVLDGILSEGLSPPQPGLVVENDAMDGDDPVLFAYTCDMPRIRSFDNILHIQGRTGTLFCFDFQEAALREVCGPNVEIQCIDFEAYERSVFHQPQETD